MSRRLVLIGVAWALGACDEIGWDECESRYPSIEQASAEKLELPSLSGTAIVTSLDGEELTRGEIDGESGNSIFYGIPSGAPVEVRIEWAAGGYVVAETESKPSEVDWVNTACLEFEDDDFTYPDDDADGAINLFEVAFENAFSDRGAGAPGDPAVVPDGFFSSVVDVIPLGDVSFALDVRERASELLVAGPAPSATGTWTENEISLIDVTNHRRRRELVACTGFATAALFNPVDRAFTGAVGCGDAVHLIDFGATDFDVEATVNTGAFASLAYSHSGDVLYKVGPTNVLGILSNGSLYSGTEDDAWDDVVSPWALADDGDHLYVPDRGNQSLNVLSHLDDDVFEHDGWALYDQLLEPRGIVLHPVGHRAYVTEEHSGTVLVVDITVDELSLVTSTGIVVAEIEAAPPPIHLAIDQRDGYWLYVTTAEKIMRVNTLTNEIEWEAPIGGTKNVPVGVAVSSEGRYGVVSSVWSAAYLLGHTTEPREEEEPNGTLATAGALADIKVGWLDTDDEGDLGAPWSATDGAPDDFEDLFAITPPAPTERLAVALIPTNTSPAFKLALLDDSGDVIDSVRSPFTSQLTTGTGLLLVSAEGASLPGAAYVGVSIRDNTPTVSPYRLQITTLAALPAIGEVEPNTLAADAQALNTYPGVLSGTVDASEVGDVLGGSPADDFEDCFSLYTGDTHLAVRLDFADTVDLNLAVLDANGNWMARHDVYATAGQPEMIIFEPQTQTDRHVVCVGIDDGAAVPTADYTLTLIDLAD